MSRADSDEAYVLDLCDEFLGTPGLRQHRFDWLLGDPNTAGRRVRLPFDAYWPDHHLVVEYHERQHAESVARFATSPIDSPSAASTAANAALVTTPTAGP